MGNLCSGGATPTATEKKSLALERTMSRQQPSGPSHGRRRSERNLAAAKKAAAASAQTNGAP
jgi:hypothetical protein